MHSFASDYRCPPHPAVVQALIEACANETDNSYGEDKTTQQATACLRRHFGPSAHVFYVSNGTAANRLALQTVLRDSYESVLCAQNAHVDTAEAGAIESLGHKATPIRTHDGKIVLEATKPYLAQRGDIHLTYPRVISIATATEVGTVYSRDALEEVLEFAATHDLIVHIDGARLANAAARVGVKQIKDMIPNLEKYSNLVITLGGTKNGGIMGDAVIFFRPCDAERAIRLQKQQGQLASRLHCIAAQFLALYSGDLWLKNAANANQMTQLLCDEWLKVSRELPVYSVESNALFVPLPQQIIHKLQEETPFYVWNEEENIVRWMCSWNTTSADVFKFIELVNKVAGQVRF